MLDPRSNCDNFLPSFYHKIKFFNGIEKYFVCRYMCVGILIHVTEKNQFYCLQNTRDTQFTFFF